MYIAVAVLTLCLFLLGVEVAHTKYCDYCQRRDVQRNWLACMRSVRNNAHIWAPLHQPSTQQVVRLAEREFIRLNTIRTAMGRDYLPRHLSGLPARDLIERYGVAA